MKRRRLASVEVEIARIDGTAPPVVPPGDWTPETVRAFNEMRPAAPASWEVIREHAATSRVQLDGWGIPDEETANILAERRNAQVEHAGGVTLASSGLLERGWVYRARRAT